ncbi:MAG: hypothetical protein FD145_1445 [Candidatus Saganbacteria bacterium]|uniref:SLH domain-containing protein n=1 Tax=Candidatus Saganbacteria bacterium TaxID=2575572 RepID=A0A833NZH8_UNCSA|nr:MAG: hypothetical protein FD145_1445 [Candidatus Saganbacteria bacterium]
MKKLLLIIFSLALICRAHALLEEINLIPMRLDSGARPMAMGGAFVGLSNDVNSVFFNPGGLPWAKGLSLNFKDINNLSAGQAYPTGYGATVGIAGILANIPDIKLANNRTTDFSNSMLVLSGGTKFSILPPLSNNKIAQNLGIGLNIKALLGQTLRRSQESDRTANGWEADFGIVYKPNKFTSIGFAGINILPYNYLGSGGKLTWDNGTTESIPAVYKAGASIKIIGDVWSPIYAENQELQLSLDLESVKSGSLAYLVGAEWGIAGRFFLRSGYYSKDQKSGTSIGLGIRAADWGIDFASGNSTCVSILYFPEEWVFEKKTIKRDISIQMSDSINLISPSNDIVTYDDRIPVVGSVKANLDVYINDQQIHVDSSNNFSAIVPLSNGKNLIIVDGYYQGGRTTVERRVFRKAKVIVSEEKLLERELKFAKTAETKKKLEEEKKKIVEKKERLETLVTMGVVEVSEDAEFSLEAAITRGELCSWLAKAANLPLQRIKSDPFKDVPKEHPFAAYIKAVADRKIMNAFSDNTFRPNAVVSEAEGKEVFKKFGVIQ